MKLCLKSSSPAGNRNESPPTNFSGVDGSGQSEELLFSGKERKATLILVSGVPSLLPSFREKNFKRK